MEKTGDRIGKISPQSRMTNQRLEIISYLQSTKEHPGAEKIYIEVRKKLPKISLGTIYRNLDVLIAKELVVKYNFSEDHDRFDADITAHHHFFCYNCHRVFDIYLPDAYQLKDRIENSEGFEVQKLSIKFLGKCNLCRS